MSHANEMWLYSKKRHLNKIVCKAPLRSVHQCSTEMKRVFCLTLDNRTTSPLMEGYDEHNHMDISGSVLKYCAEPLLSNHGLHCLVSPVSYDFPCPDEQIEVQRE